MTNNHLKLAASNTLSALGERQRLFVEKYVELGGKRGAASEAALYAGYGCSGDTPNKRSVISRGSELLRNPDVLAAIRDEMTRKLSAAAVLGVNVLVDLAEDESAPPATRLSAAKELVDRGYGPVASRFMHTHDVRTVDDIVIELTSEDELNASSDTLAIDAEFQDIEE